MRPSYDQHDLQFFQFYGLFHVTILKTNEQSAFLLTYVKPNTKSFVQNRD